ncbi:MAG TPA: ATP-dependent zinc metalloprotease FtsH [Patescibacteria group bacterium]|nr:ATP-dependent zinc metalloprotease FtsH [Patescibacteria group bacterium]
MVEKKEEKPQVKKYELKFNFSLRRLLIWVLILFLFLPEVIFLLTKNAGIVEEIPLTSAIGEIKTGNVEKVEIRGDEIALIYPEENGVPKIKLTRKEEGSSFVETLQRAEVDPGKVKVEVTSQTFSRILGGVVSLVLPIIAFGLLMIFLMRRRGGPGGDMMFGMGKSRAKLFVKGKQSITFKDVAGVDEAKKDLEEVVDFLKHPKKYRELGARTPKGVLLVGPAGVGKTLLAKAVAGEAGVPFFSMAGSEFMEMLVGVGASRVRDLFETAKKAAPSIIFIDELDAIGRIRGVGMMGGHDERDQTLNQILVEMDGFTGNDNVIVLAATNRPDVLDPALLRPGRFDRRVVLDLPDLAGREAIMKIHSQGKPFAKVTWDKVAKRTVGFSGADLENMLNEAAIGAARENRKAITEADLEEAATRVKLGPEKKRLQSPREREMTAYHEAGHAVVGHLLPGADPVHRVSIVSRGMALGFTMSRPETDKYQQTESELKDLIAVMQGGRAAEEVIYDERTGGAANDIERATRIARAMVTDFGMSDLGPISMGPMYETSDWGRAYAEPYKVSDVMQGKIDEEVKRLVEEGFDKAVKIIGDNRTKMDGLVRRLLEVETVEQEEFEKIMGIKKAVFANRDELVSPKTAK